MRSPLTVSHPDWLVSAEICGACRLCCVFDPARATQPCFTAIEAARLAPAEAERLVPRGGHQQVELNPGASPSARPCAFLDPRTHLCGIYTRHPLDCQLFPFFVVGALDGEVQLCVDLSCPGVRAVADTPEFDDYCAALHARLGEAWDGVREDYAFLVLEAAQLGAYEVRVVGPLGRDTGASP
ncbi:MAG: YkgJ family cysteine cluster protein [Alphaproteobacteria bacterium]|nr:YkgJ family cysteine cluster protein [Alphaproteobacteria bacterium]